MKRSNLISVVIPLWLLLLSNSCRKHNEDQLPPDTQSGSNTFGCFINAKVWVPTGRGAFSGINPTSGGFFGEPNGLVSIYIKAFRQSDRIDIYLKNISAVGTYHLNENTSTMPTAVLPEASYGKYAIDNNPESVTDSLHKGVVTITHADRNTGIVSGTFQMTVYKKNTGEVLNITDGRFDYETH